MKTFVYAASLVLLSAITGCSGSDTYRGAWKAMDMKGNKWAIIFYADSFTVKNDKGIAETYQYTQNAVKIENAKRSYGITLKDGRAFTITFPIAGNTSKGLISLATSEALYTIGRNDYVEFAELLPLANEEKNY